MDQATRTRLMELWRKDVKVLVAGGWPKIPSERWAPLARVGRRRGPAHEAREWEESVFIGRVIVRLYEFGLQSKEFADVWGFTNSWVYKLHKRALVARKGMK